MSESPTTQTGEIKQAVDSQLEAAQEQAADHEPHMGEGEFNNAQDQVDDQIDQGDHGDMGEGEFDRNTDDEDDQGDGEVPMGFSRTDFELEELSDIAQLDDMKIAMGFICAIENTSLDDDDCRLGEEAIDRLRHPPQQPVDIDSPDLRLGLDLFNSLSNSSQETYTSVRQAILRRHPEDNIPSYDQIKHQVAEITGVVSIVHDMCVNTCIAFAGPFSQLDSCPKCGQPRYDPTILANSSGKKKVVRQEFHTIPIGPQLQALWRSEESATSMHYAEIRTKEILKELEINEGVLESYEDVVNGSDYLEAVSSGRIGPHDALLMFLLDGAQLHKNKASDCWIGIWIVFNLSPDSR